MNNIILIGYMGSGKSSVGQALANMQKYQFVDTDIWIENKQNCKISEIFEKEGEEFFRNLETEVLKELTEQTKRMIISVGGGLPLREQNRELLKDLGIVIYLKVSLEVVLKRLEKDRNRPLLQGKNRRQIIAQMLANRNPIYEEASDYQIDTDLLSHIEVVKEIQEIIRRNSNEDLNH